MSERLKPLQNSHEASELEAELKDLFVKLYTDSMASTADDINVYGAPHLGSFALVERNIDRDGLSVLRETTEARIRYLFRGWRHRNPERGLHFIRLYLTALFGDAWVIDQMWQRKDAPYPTALATTSDGANSQDHYLTSRVRVDIDSEIVPAKILSSLRSAIAARILLTVRIGRTLNASVGTATLAYNWHVFRVGKYGTFADPPVFTILESNPDSAGSINGMAGAPNVLNVLTNDTMSGSPASMPTVAITTVVPATPIGGGPVPTLNPATGFVSVPAGTPAGVYTINYTICQQSYPTNFDTATATITVVPAPIDAVNNGFSVSASSLSNTASVLANDTLNGAAVSLAAVSLTPGTAPAPAAGSIAMNTDGTITIASGTTAGTYTYPYTICEILNPTNCDTATATIVVGSTVIDAINDSGTVANGATGGVAVADVLATDTLNGVPATLGTVTITQLATGNPGVTLNTSTGAVNVAPATPAGVFVVTYQICEIANPTNCDTAQVTVTVGAAPIDAVGDSGTVADGTPGGVAVANALANDTLNGVPATLGTVNLTQVSSTSPNVTINTASGAVNVAPNTPANTYTLTYQICETLNPTNCDTATVTVTVSSVTNLNSVPTGIEDIQEGSSAPVISTSGLSFLRNGTFTTTPTLPTGVGNWGPSAVDTGDAYDLRITKVSGGNAVGSLSGVLTDASSGPVQVQLNQARSIQLQATRNTVGTFTGQRVLYIELVRRSDSAVISSTTVTLIVEATIS